MHLTLRILPFLGEIFGMFFSILTIPYLSLGFITPFCLPWIYSGPLKKISPHLIGIEGDMPINQLEKLVFGTIAGHRRLQYSTSMRLDSQSNSQMHRGEGLPTIGSESIPAGHRVFTLVDTASPPEKIVNSISARTNCAQGTLTVTVFTAPKPPTVALLCGHESGFFRAVMCSYSAAGNCLHTETVLRMETSKWKLWESSATLGWVKLAMS